MPRLIVNQSGNVTSDIKSALENWSGGSEADVRRVLVEPVLNALGWNIMDTMEVRAEYKMPKLSGKTPNYVLFYDELPVVLIEVNSLNNINDAKNQLKKYCGNKYVGIATDGNMWCVLIDGKWDIQIAIPDTKDIIQDLFGISKVAATDRYKNKLVSKKVLGRFDMYIPNNKEVKDWEANIKDTNKALQLLNLFVVKNKDKFRDEESFNLMLRVYVNVIGIVKGEKHKIQEILEKETFVDLQNKNKIIKMCIPQRISSCTNNELNF